MAKHGSVKDSGEYFVINPTSRKVTVPHAHKSIGTVGDHNSEQITFECPQIVDGHDVSQCANRYITWINVKEEFGNDRLEVAEVENGADGMIYLSWTITNLLTVAQGLVQFAVHFEDVDENGDVVYRWSTATCKDCDILGSINTLLGVYESMYVSDNTLVIADYTPVNDGGLTLETDGIIPEGECQITKNGRHPVGEYATVEVMVDAPTETLDVITNGTHDVLNYANVDVDVRQPDGHGHIGVNGTHDVEWLKTVEVDVMEPEGEVEITSNGSHDVMFFETAIVNVTPRLGNKHITQNTKDDETYDVADYNTVTVDVPEPYGTYYAYTNGTHGVKSFELVEVAVPQPEGAITITENSGEAGIDVSKFATAHVRVPQPYGNKLINKNHVTENISQFETVTVEVPEPYKTLFLDRNVENMDIFDYKTLTVDIPEPTEILYIDRNCQDVDVSNVKTLTVNVVEKELTQVLTLTKNEDNVDVRSVARVNVRVGKPMDTLDINASGYHDVSNYAGVNVTFPAPQGTYDIRANGEYDVAKYAKANVVIPEPSAHLNITENMEGIDVRNCATVSVAVPLETPQVVIDSNGTVTATANGKSTTRALTSEFDSEFVSENIKKGVTIFGVTGTADVGICVDAKTFNVVNKTTTPVTVSYMNCVTGNIKALQVEIYRDGKLNRSIANGSIFTIKYSQTDKYEPIDIQIGGCTLLSDTVRLVNSNNELDHERCAVYSVPSGQYDLAGVSINIVPKT